MRVEVKIAIVDDHKLFRSGMINLVHSLKDSYKVIIDAGNGQELLNALSVGDLPDVVLLDVNMPVMDGYEVAEQMRQKYPKCKILVLTMNDDEQSLVRMLKLGVRGYIGKDIEPNELRDAIESILEKNYYYTDQLTNQLILSLSSEDNAHQHLTEQEKLFIRLACSEDTYIQIADKMNLSPKTIDGYRAAVFEKLNIKSRVGLAIYAIKSGLAEI